MLHISYKFFTTKYKNNPTICYEQAVDSAFYCRVCAETHVASRAAFSPRLI